MQLQIQWTTAYFEHPAFKDRETLNHDPATLNWVVPSLKHAPSIYNGMLVGTHIHFDTIMADLAILGGFKTRLHENFLGLHEKSDSGARVKIKWLAGTMSCATCVAGMWYVQDPVHGDDVEYQWLEGANHFVSPHYFANP